MEQWLGPWREYCYAVLRIVAALLYFCHGTQKLFAVSGGRAVVGNPLLLVSCPDPAAPSLVAYQNSFNSRRRRMPCTVRCMRSACQPVPTRYSVGICPSNAPRPVLLT